MRVGLLPPAANPIAVNNNNNNNNNNNSILIYLRANSTAQGPITE
jgi:hypothetical protein